MQTIGIYITWMMAGVGVFVRLFDVLSERNAFKCYIGVCDIEKNYISIYIFFFSITIIRRYFAECVIVLISEYRAQLQFLIFFIFCVLSSHEFFSYKFK